MALFGHEPIYKKGQCFMQLGVNEAGTLKSSSILIYSHQEQSIYAQNEWYNAVVIKQKN